MKSVPLTVNGKKHVVTVAPDTPLLWVLRDTLGLTGTKFGCGLGVCGACTVHQNGVAVRSCSIAVADAKDKSYTTIEGLTAADHPCRTAWIEEDVAQCGYCQPGMIMTAAALLKEKPDPSDADINRAMSDIVCRCGTYLRVRKAIHRAAKMKGGRRK